MLTHMPDSRGGSVLWFAAKVAFARGPRLLPLYASSAATMWLAYPEAVVDPRSIFGFHRVARDLTGLATRIYEAHLKRVSPELLEWYRGLPDEDDVISRGDRLTGKFMIEKGWVKPWKPEAP